MIQTATYTIGLALIATQPTPETRPSAPALIRQAASQLATIERWRLDRLDHAETPWVPLPTHPDYILMLDPGWKTARNLTAQQRHNAAFAAWIVDPRWFEHAGVFEPLGELADATEIDWLLPEDANEEALYEDLNAARRVADALIACAAHPEAVNERAAALAALYRALAISRAVRAWGDGAANSTANNVDTRVLRVIATHYITPETPFYTIPRLGRFLDAQYRPVDHDRLREAERESVRLMGLEPNATAAFIRGLERDLVTRDCRYNLTRTALAIERFRHVERRLPGSLDELPPPASEWHYPIDPADAEPLRYHPDPTAPRGYRLYSIGPDRRDNAGRELRHIGIQPIPASYEIVGDITLPPPSPHPSPDTPR